MGDRIGVLIVHGMGSQEPGYSKPFVQELSHELGSASRHVVWEEVVWGTALREREEQLWNSMQSAVAPDGTDIPLSWLPARQFVLRFVGDALAYHREGQTTSARATIHEVISRHVGQLDHRLDDPRAPVVVLAHSLGAYIMSDYVWDRQHPGGAADSRRALNTLTGMITFGCCIPLFALALDTPAPIDLPGTDVTGPVRDAARWLNYLDRDDIVAWPIKPLYARELEALTPAQRETVSRIEDHEIDVGGPITRWNPASHEGYWTDQDFIRPVARYLAALVRAWHETIERHIEP